MIYTISPEKSYIIDKVTGADIDSKIIKEIKDDITSQIERQIEEKLV